MMKSMNIESMPKEKRAPWGISLALLFGGMLAGFAPEFMNMASFDQLHTPQMVGKLMAIFANALIPWANGFLQRRR